MKAFFKEIRDFVTATILDDRIPLQDKKILSGVGIILVIRILFIPDWIPYFGILDILFLIGLIVDYFFGVLDQILILSHYPWGMKSFARLRRVASFLSLFAPGFVKDNLWSYKKDPF